MADRVRRQERLPSLTAPGRVRQVEGATLRPGGLSDPLELLAAGPADHRTPESVAPPPGNPRFPHLDSLRAIAALCIVVLHVIPLSGALAGSRFVGLVAHLDIGVTIFFLLSGFLLYRPFLAARVLGAPASRTRDYAWRRLLRIAPAYWFALSILGVVPGLYGVFTGNWWVYYGLLQNYPVYTTSADCGQDILRCGINPAWSLGIEAAFYASLPVFAFGMARLTARLGRSRWLQRELLVLAVVASLSVPIALGLETDPPWLGYSPLGFAWWFALGMGLAAVSVRYQELGDRASAARLLRMRPGTAWAAAGSMYALLCLVLIDPVPGRLIPGGQYLLEYLLFGVIAALILLPAIFASEGASGPRRILANPILSWLGLISYGIFLWHWPIVYALYRGGVPGWWPSMALPIMLTLTLTITIACASISYYLVERPLLRLKYGIGRRSLARRRAPNSTGDGH